MMFSRFTVSGEGLDTISHRLPPDPDDLTSSLTAMAKWLAVGLGALLVLIGAVWTLQGVGYLGGSFMTGQKLWTGIGSLCVIGGLVLGVSGLRRK
jgi:hypothetical protein